MGVMVEAGVVGAGVVVAGVVVLFFDKVAGWRVVVCLAAPTWTRCRWVAAAAKQQCDVLCLG
ncbi:unnamed protein product [Prunus armeniaca]|uniref:Uncharacterized protein n=1 Tax=Prunus armeniaca TaxID=36596 RepID=A0A6J5WQE5_PRUAR|nr:unnamed protein product [Prunus armeniaca]